MRWAIILAGGSGTRFWPLSTPGRPKQLLPLIEAGSTAQQAVSRLTGLIPPERILVVTSPALGPLLGAALGLPEANVMLEPRPASTGPALAWGSWEARQRDPEAEILSLHADWSVAEPDLFRSTAAAALGVAGRHQRLVTVGVVPTRPETGYGYIIPGGPLDEDARTVERFVEKPSAAGALDLMASGALWNTGLFAWTARDLFRELGLCTPEIAPFLSLLDQGDVTGFFDRVRPISIDVGLLERSHAVAVVPGRFHWDDVGTWEALGRVRSRDDRGNVTVGPVHLFDCTDCIVWSDGEPIVLSGVRDLVIAHANGRTLVMHRSHSADLKQVLDALPDRVRDLTDA